MTATAAVVLRFEAWVHASLPALPQQLELKHKTALAERLFKFADDLVVAAEIDGTDVCAERLDQILALAAETSLETIDHAASFQSAAAA